MASTLVILEHRLEGTSNFNTWKVRVLNILEEHDLDGYVSNVVKDPTTNARWTTFKNNKAKSKWIIYDLGKENLMPMIIPLKTEKECFNTLTNLYDKKDLSQKRELNNKLHNLKMEKDEVVDSFFTKIS